jgi:hypothetical protein
MDVDKNEWKTLKRAIDAWETQGTVSHETAGELRKTLELKRNDNQQIARYFFIVAISCSILAFGAIFIDEKVLEKLKAYFALSNVFIAICSTILGIVWFWYVRRKSHTLSPVAYEVYMVLGALILLTSLVYFCKDIGFGAQNSGFLFAALVVLLSVGFWFKSRAIWMMGLLAIFAWYSAFTTVHSHGNQYLGMNYPVRFTFLGLILIGASYLIKRVQQLHFIQRATYLTGLALFLVALWMVSIFGNYGYLDEWAKVRQVQVLVYGFIFGIISFSVFYLGIKKDDDTTRDFGILFLLINLYSRYFEYFWDNTNKGIFFTILAASFYFLGRFIEKRKKKSSRNRLFDFFKKR